MKTDMMAAVLYGRESLRVEPVAVPPIGPGDLLVRVRVALTCGTDVKVFRRGYHARMIVPPAVFGHELAGDIVAAGSDVKRFTVGQRVMAANSAPCGKCNYCLPESPQSVRRPAVQQRRLCRVHPDSFPDRREEHLRDSGSCELSRRRAG